MEHVDQSTPAYAGHETQPITLILEGGGLRCQFTAGVLDFFMEQGLVCKDVVGVSAGALSGANYVAGLYGRTCLMNMKYCKDDRYLSLKSFVKTGNVCGREFAFHEVMDVLMPFDKTWFSNSPMSLTTVCTNLVSGEADYHRMADLTHDLPYLIATSSLPFLSQPVDVDGKLLLDGGTADSIPFLYGKTLGNQKMIVVLTQHAEYLKKPNKMVPLARRLYSDHAYFVDRIEYRHFEYNRQHRAVMDKHAAGELFMLIPEKPVEISLLNAEPEDLLDLYAEGYRVAAEQWPALQAYLAK